MRQKLIDMIEAELTKPRQITEQVLDNILSHYSYTLDQIDKFFAEEIANLEDYEIDILFSPIFTPKVQDKAMFSKILDEIEIDKDGVDEIVKELEKRSLRANLYVVFKNGDKFYEKSFSIPLNSVNLKRYVKLLNLDCKPSKEFSKMIETTFKDKSDEVKAILRDEFWKEEWREEFLKAYLVYVSNQGDASLEKFELLLKILRGNPTASSIYEIYELISDVIQWTEIQVNVLKTGRRQFFNDMIEQSYREEGTDKRPQSEEELRKRESELLYYLELRDEIGYIIENMKEFLTINTARRFARI
ncbi:hypothetical protein JGI9_01330 [Candidatus Kryptonium thompsonii]|nr:hypothetical protein JGI9_01330 [Candidatus Kryptonium thompsoni]